MHWRIFACVVFIAYFPTLFFTVFGIMSVLITYIRVALCDGGKMVGGSRRYRVFHSRHTTPAIWAPYCSLVNW